MGRLEPLPDPSLPEVGYTLDEEPAPWKADIETHLISKIWQEIKSSLSKFTQSLSAITFKRWIRSIFEKGQQYLFQE